MPFTLAQLEFVGVHLGLAIAPDFIENKRSAEKYAQLRAQFDSEHPDLKDHHQSQTIGAALLECDELAKAGNKFAAALESLARARDLAEMPPPPVEAPPPVEPQPPAPVVPPELNVVADAPVSANVEKEVPSDVAPPPLENPPVQDAQPPVAQPAPVQPPVAPQQPPAPALPANPVDAIKTILQAAGSAQETIRAGNSDLMQLQSRFLDLQMERKEKQPGNDFDGLTAQMTQIVDDIKRVISSQDQALAQIVAQQNLLLGIPVNAPDAPPTAAAIHQKATAEMADRLRKAQAICDGSAKMRDNAIKALADGSFTAKAGVAVYGAELFELPSVLRDLIGKLESTTKQYRDAKSQLDPLLNTASGLLNTASAGKPLPVSAGNDMNQMEATATRLSKNFGAWNASINNPWKSVRAQLAGVKKEDNLEATDLFWRGEKLYDAFSQAYGEADEAGKNVIHMVSKLRLYTNAAPASTAAADGEIRSLIDAMDKLRTVVNDPVGRLNDAKRELPGKKKALASVDTTAIASLEKRSRI